VTWSMELGEEYLTSTVESYFAVAVGFLGSLNDRA